MRFSLMPEYRGVRVRPYMRHLFAILSTILTLCFLSPFGYYVYSRFESYKVVDKWLYGYSGGYILFSILFSIYLSWFLQDATPLFKRLERLTRSARFLYENGFIYTKQVKGKGVTKVTFPKVYLKQGKYSLEIAFEMAGNKFQNRFKQIGGELEDTFFMDFMEVTDDSRFKTYTLAYSALLNRIKVTDVHYERGVGLSLMKNFYWDFDSDPHLLVSGGTGGGKTVLLRTLSLGLSKMGAVDVCDPKRADFVSLADTKAFKGRVFFDIPTIVTQFENALLTMMARYDFMRQERERLGHKDLKKYYEYGLEPYFLICDEYNALMSMLNMKDRGRVEDAFGQFLLLGRQAGCFGIVGMQKPAREDLSSKLQANINCRISVGRLDDGGYSQLFGEVNSKKSFKYVKYVGGRRVYGRGYCAIYGDVAREFYSPLMPDGFEFTSAFEKVERHKNPYSPLENNAVDDSLMKSKELQDFIDEANAKEEEALDQLVPDDAGFDWIDVKTIAEKKRIPDSTLRTIIKLIEEKGYEFSRKQSKTILTREEAIFLEEVIDEKIKTGKTYRIVVDQMSPSFLEQTIDI